MFVEVRRPTRGFHALHRGDGLAKSMSSYLSRRVEGKPNIEILPHTEIRKMMGGKVLEAVELENTQTHERRTLQTGAVFSMIGAKPCTDWLPPEIERDEKGFIKTGQAVADAPAWKDAARAPGPLEPQRVRAALQGDVEGAAVALSIRRHLESTVIDDPDEVPVQVSGREKVAR